MYWGFKRLKKKKDNPIHLDTSRVSDERCDNLNQFTSTIIGNGGSYSNVRVNGKTISVRGNNISVCNNRIIVDGKVVSESLSGDITIIVEGSCGNLKASGNVEIQGDCGNIDCGGSCTVRGNVSGDIDAGGSITCGNVGGSIDAGGSVRCSRL